MEDNEILEEQEPETDEVTNLKNELAAARADLYNYRQRAEKDKTRIRNMMSEERILDFLPVLDNLERALNVPNDATAADILKGVQMVQRQFLGILQELGVEPIAAEKGTDFDHSLHYAMGTDEVEDEENSGKITSVILPGYRTNEKVLRPAQVRVGKILQEVNEDEQKNSGN